MDENLKELKSILKESFNIKINEIYLSLIVFIYIKQVILFKDIFIDGIYFLKNHSEEVERDG